jgi:hypothetical protein
MRSLLEQGTPGLDSSQPRVGASGDGSIVSAVALAQWASKIVQAAITDNNTIRSSSGTSLSASVLAKNMFFGILSYISALWPNHGSASRLSPSLIAAPIIDRRPTITRQQIPPELEPCIP